MKNYVNNVGMKKDVNNIGVDFEKPAAGGDSAGVGGVEGGHCSKERAW